MRLLHTSIVDLGTKYNDENRITYRGIRAKVLGNKKEGDTFRFVTWNWSSEDKKNCKRISMELWRRVDFCSI